MSWAERAADQQQEAAEEAAENRRLVSAYEEALGKVMVLATKALENMNPVGSRADAKQHFEWIVQACKEAGFEIKS